MGFGVLFNFIATFTYLSFHLAAPPFNRSPAFLGSIFVVYLVGSAASLWLGRAIAWFGRRTFVLCVLGVWACGMLASLLPSVPAIVFALVIASTCGILTQASSTSFVAITAKTGTSAAVGLYVTSFYVGGTFGGYLPGLASRPGVARFAGARRWHDGGRPSSSRRWKNEPLLAQQAEAMVRVEWNPGEHRRCRR